MFKTISYTMAVLVALFTSPVNMGTAQTLFEDAAAKEKDFFRDGFVPVMPPIEKSIECMAMNIYHESRNESYEGQLAVGLVTMNRVNSDLFPDSVCEVVYQARYSTWWKETHGKDVPLRHKCQFSWYCDGKSDKVYEPDKYEYARDIAYRVITEYNNIPDVTYGALWYHADYVTPNWSSDYIQTAQIDTHIFYRK